LNAFSLIRERAAAVPEAQLADGILLSVQGISRAAPRPDPAPPGWLARILPGVHFSTEPDEEEDEVAEEPEEATGPSSPLDELSFDIAAGEGVGLLGDGNSAELILRMLSGLSLPSTGRILVRGRVAPLMKGSSLNLSGQPGRKALDVTATYLHWPRQLVRERWDEIVEFACLEELDGRLPAGSLELEMARTKRLILSTALHLDATVYAVGGTFAGSDVAMYERCCDLLEQRQREGCVIVQRGRRVGDLGRFCRTAILFDRGKVLLQGRLGEIAKLMEERRLTALARKPLPIRALLADKEELVEVGPGGGTIEMELDVFASALELELALLFTDEEGRETRVAPPEPVVLEEAGVYRLRVAVPGGVLGDSKYSAMLFGSRTPNGATEPPPKQELLAFDVIAQEAQSDLALPQFGSVDVLAGDEQALVQDVEWHVGRVTST
jgi:ABC-type polysaccharide/polyol phosphate transport system ATPase subunit